MGAATEGAVLVNHAGAVVAQHGARTVVAFGHNFASRGAQGPRGQDGFASGELRRAPSELELAAFGAADAGALNGAALQLAVNGADFLQRFAAQLLLAIGRAKRFFCFHLV